MKQKKNLFFMVVFVTLATLLVLSCASGPKLGNPTLIQQSLNKLPAISVAGQELQLEFGGDTWIAKKNGKNALAGTFSSKDTKDGCTIKLKQTHRYSTEQKPAVGGDVGWVKAAGPEIELVYKEGPPATLTTK